MNKKSLQAEIELLFDRVKWLNNISDNITQHDLPNEIQLRIQSAREELINAIRLLTPFTRPRNPQTTQSKTSDTKPSNGKT